jgi:hypothetical protein
MIPFITPKKINIIRAIMILGFLANIIVIFGKAFTPNWYSFLNTIFFLSFILGIALYDEFQNIYLVIKVYNSIRAKPNQVEHFQKLIYMNISMILIDILAIGSFIMGVFTTGSWQRIGFNISTALQGSHGIVLLYLFIGMIELKFSERIAMQKNEKKLKTKKKNEASLSRLGPDTNLNN